MMTGRLSYDSSRNSVPLLQGMNYQDKAEDSDSLPDRIQEGSYHSSQNEYGHSYSFIEFCVKSQIFTREFAETNGRRQSKANQEEADPDLIYSLYIGGQLAKQWSAADDQWEEDALVEQIKGNKKQKNKSGEPYLRTRRFKVPFECRFVT